jgi:hypothetical protein
MGLEERIRAYKRSARRSFYLQQNEYGGNARGITNWRMLIARRFKVSIAEVRRILGEGS